MNENKQDINLNNDINDLQPMSLGASNPSPQIEENTPVESLDVLGFNPSVDQNIEKIDANPMVDAPNIDVLSSSNTPTAVPIPGTENGYTNMNNIENPNIGINPPEDDKPKKKGFNKVLFIILIVVLMGGVAFFVYYFLNISNDVKLSVQTLTLNVNDIVPDKVTSYAKVLKGSTSNCTLDTSGVDTSKMGNYKVSITCGKDTYQANVIVADKEAPKIELNAIFRTVGNTLKVEDFVKSCTDPSNCNVKIENEEELNNYLNTAGGPYKVKILAEDDNQNQAIYETDLYVTEEEIYLYLKCSSKEVDVTNYKAKKVVSDILPITKEGFGFLGVARRDYTYTFATIEDYNTAVGNKDLIMTFDSITGLANYNDETKTLVISTDLTSDTIKSEVGESPFSNYMEIQSYYQAKGIDPQLIPNYPETK